MEDPFVDYCTPWELAGAADAFICAECGEGFFEYSKLVSHTAIHGTSDSMVVDTRDDLEKPIEFALHKNGTLTLVERLDISDSLNKISNRSLDPQPKSAVKKSAENVQSLFTCERCGQVFTSQLSLRQHQRYHSLVQGYNCTLCCKVHSNKEDLREHLQDHSHERFYSCGHCGKRFLKKETLSAHQKESHASLVGRSSGKIEKNQESLGKYYQCKLCDLHFFWLSDLQSHLISHSLKKVATNVTETVSNVKGGRGARSNKRPDRLYRCGLCGARFRVFADFRVHNLSHQTRGGRAKTVWSKIPPKRASSDSTYKPFTQRKSLKRSRRSKSSQKYFPCKYCSRVFMHSSSLSRHNRYHKGTMHCCVHCGKQFPQRCDLTRHIIIYHRLELKTKLRSSKRRKLSPENSSSDEMMVEKDGDSDQGSQSPKSQGALSDQESESLKSKEGENDEGEQSLESEDKDNDPKNLSQIRSQIMKNTSKDQGSQSLESKAGDKNWGSQSLKSKDGDNDPGRQSLKVNNGDKDHESQSLKAKDGDVDQRSKNLKSKDEEYDQGGETLISKVEENDQGVQTLKSKNECKDQGSQSLKAKDRDRDQGHQNFKSEGDNNQGHQSFKSKDENCDQGCQSLGSKDDDGDQGGQSLESKDGDDGQGCQTLKSKDGDTDQGCKNLKADNEDNNPGSQSMISENVGSDQGRRSLRSMDRNNDQGRQSWKAKDREVQDSQSLESEPPKSGPSFRCSECGKEFGLLSVYQRHLGHHKSATPKRVLHKCPHCRCRFSQLSALERHLQTHKSKTADKTKSPKQKDKPMEKNESPNVLPHSTKIEVKKEDLPIQPKIEVKEELVTVVIKNENIDSEDPGK